MKCQHDMMGGLCGQPAPYTDNTGMQLCKFHARLRYKHGYVVEPPIEGDPAQQRDEILAKHVERNPNMMAEAPRLIRKFLREHGPASCETIVDYLKTQGCAPENAKDDRAFGGVFNSLSRSRAIVRVGFEARRKGHLAPGASIWRIADD